MKKYSIARLKIQQRQRRLRNGALLGLLVGGIGLFAIWNSHPAFGLGGTGSGGGAGACSNYCTDNGHGWLLYPTGSGGPDGGFNNGTAWSDVEATCAGVSEVAVYVIYNGTGMLKGYDYKDSYAGFGGLIEDRDGFISIGSAQSAFDNLDPSYTGGYTFGSNVSWFCYGSAENWTINGQSYIMVNGGGRQQGTTKAILGAKLEWDHDLRNEGPSDMSKKISYAIERTGGFTGPKYSDGKVTGKGKGTSDELFFTAYAPSFKYSVYKPIESDVGHTLCQYISWGPSSPSDDSWTDSESACATIRSNYSLYPQVKIGGGTSGVIIVGGTADQQSSVENTAAKSDVPSDYQSYDFAVQAGKSIDLGTVFKDQGNGRTFALAPGGTDICAWLASKYPAGTVACKGQVANGSSMFSSGTSAVDQTAINAAGFKAGDLICRMLWIDHYDYNHTTSNERRVSLPACVRVAKTPYIQFWGGDVRVGDSIGGATSSQANAYTSSNRISGKTLGSWAEYGIFAPTNGIIQSASAGALSGKDGFAGQATDTDVSHLTFANTTTPKGNWSTPASVASYESSFGLPDGGAVAAASISLDTLANRGKVTLTNNGTVHIGGTLHGGSLMLLYPTGTVVIDSNIMLGTNSYSSLTDFSQIVIQAKNIIIAHDVDRVDAWLVAIAQNGTDGGVVSTCDAIVTPYYSGLSAKADSPCSQKPLRINGPVMGREVQLRRTFGAEGDNTPAEIIDLRADAYLWTLQAANNGSIDTIFTTELPPRF